MRAVVFHDFGGPLAVEQLADPSPTADGVVIAVEATGLCRSDWHGWRGHDDDIRSLPHVPGHELAGSVVEVGRDVSRGWLGHRVTIPFVAGCGACPECNASQPQVCDHQYQPGFTGWGSYAELVAVRYAEANLVALPDSMTSITAASLGCRLATAYRAVAHQAKVNPGEWVAIHGCGGVGLSAVMVAGALGTRVIAVDVRDEPLAKARQLGAEHTLNAREVDDIPSAIRELTGRGAHASFDTLGHRATMRNSILSLRKRGRHVQVGLLAGDDLDPPTPWGRVIGWELELLGSHGMATAAYPELFAHIAAGRIDPTGLLDRTLTLDEAPAALASLDDYHGCGVAVIEP